MKELIRVRVQYASRQQCCETHKRPLPFFLCVCKKVQNVKLVTTVQWSQFDGLKCGHYISKPCGMSLCYRSTTQTVYTVCWAYATPMPSSSCPALWRQHRSCCWRHSMLPTISFIASPAKCDAKESLAGFYFILLTVLWKNFYYFKYTCTFARINEVNKLDKC